MYGQAQYQKGKRQMGFNKTSQHHDKVVILVGIVACLCRTKCLISGWIYDKVQPKMREMRLFINDAPPLRVGIPINDDYLGMIGDTPVYMDTPK